MQTKYLNPKNYVRKLVEWFISPALKELGFINYHSHFIWGPKDNLILKNPETCSLVNTLFNTRSGRIFIDEYVRFSHNCLVLTGKHNYEAKDVLRFSEVATEGRDISIGYGTWIASGAIILGGVTIGKHCVIAAGSVVTKDLPDYSFAAGVPAKVLRKI